MGISGNIQNFCTFRILAVSGKEKIGIFLLVGSGDSKPRCCWNINHEGTGIYSTICWGGKSGLLLLFLFPYPCNKDGLLPIYLPRWSLAYLPS